MQKSCPSCGADIFPGARFCRRCGGPLREDGGTADVSPRAATVPLHEAEGRATEALVPEQHGRPSADTSRVSLSEMERLLRSQQGPALNASDPEPSRPQSQHAAHSAVTRPDSPLDEELTITVPRAAPDTRDTTPPAGFDATPDLEATHDFEATRPAQGAHDAHEEDLTLIAADRQPPQAAGARGPRAAGPPPAARRRWPVVLGVLACVVALAGLATFVAVKLFRRPALTDLPTQGPTAPPPAPEAAGAFEEKMAEAEALLAQGNMEAAVARLREANAIDPANSRAHRRLAELLLASGARREAIDELRAAARNAPDDFTVWRQLASAQFAEGLYREAADSYRRLLALVGDAADPNDLLSYADSLRLSGRAEEARAVYQKLRNAAPPDVAELARQRLEEMAQAQATPTPTPHDAAQPGQQREGETASLNPPDAQASPQASPTPPARPPQQQPTPQAPAAREQAATPDEHYRRGQGLWSSNRPAALEEFRAAAAGGAYDAHYYLGLSYVEGRNLHALKRAEVVAALQHFQLAQRGRHYVSESRRYQQQLEKEFDRLRGQ